MHEAPDLVKLCTLQSITLSVVKATVQAVNQAAIEAADAAAQAYAAALASRCRSEGEVFVPPAVALNRRSLNLYCRR
jgi:hypothetical protein